MDTIYEVGCEPFLTAVTWLARPPVSVLDRYGNQSGGRVEVGTYVYSRVVATAPSTTAAAPVKI